MSSTDLFPLKQITEVLVRTTQKPNLENVAAEGKALIFQFAVPFLIPSTPLRTKPSSFMVVDLL